MQVTHVQDHCTHAVIGGKQSIEFGISNSAEFFNILSSTLYKDQILAVVRETLCNAWDAHIEARCTDRPVLVTLDHEKLVIKDLGKGIHHDDMGLIYGTYGNSTKKNDGHQTGGFGLGCKSPFAYTDHFEVVSCHAGIKTIYNLSKSSAQAQGKPGITPIASFPTTDTGLTVTIRIKAADHARFETLINRIVHNGDMNVLLNSKQIDTVGFDLSKGNYLITPATLLDTDTAIMVRYGNVVYPVDYTKEIADRYEAIQTHLQTLKRNVRHLPHPSIVFQAPAHSISVTPSRESLSMQEHTVNTLNQLFADFLNLLKGEFVVECNKYAETITQKAVDTKRIDQLLKTGATLPDLHDAEHIAHISDLATMAKAYMRYNYPKGLEYRKADVTRRLEQMVQAGLLDRGKVQTFLLALNEVNQEDSDTRSGNRQCEPNSWLQRRVLAPLLKRIYQSGLDESKLFVCNDQDSNWAGRNAIAVPLVPATSARPHHLLATLPYLRNIIVLTTRRAELCDCAFNHDVFKTAGKYQGFLVYVVGRKKGEIETARQFFNKQGMRVCDLTLLDEETPRTPKATPTPRKPAKKGIPCVSSVLVAHSKDRISIEQARYESAARIEQPEFIIKIANSRSTSNYSFEDWRSLSSYYIVKLFGDKGGVVISTASHDKWLAKGVKDVGDYVQEKVCSYMLNNPRIEKYWASRSELINKEVDNSPLIDLIYSNEILKKEFGIVDYLTQEDRMYLHLWGVIEHKWWGRNAIATVRDWLQAIPEAPGNQILIDKLKNPLVDLLDVRYLASLLKQETPSPHQDKAIQFAISLINN